MSYDDGLEGEMDARKVMPVDKDLSQLNREVAEWLGVCIHKNIWHDPNELDVMTFYDKCLDCGELLRNYDYPNFIQHPVELLRLMMKREDWPVFSSTATDGTPLKYRSADKHRCPNCNELLGYMPGLKYSMEIDRVRELLELVTDTTGLLLRKVGEWKGRKDAWE